MENKDKLLNEKMYLLKLVKCRNMGRLSLTVVGLMLGISLTKEYWIIGYLFSMITQYALLINLRLNIKECLITNSMLKVMMLKSGLILIFYTLIAKYLLFKINTSITIALAITISIFIHRVIINIILKEPFLYYIFKDIQLTLVLQRGGDEDDK